MPAGILVEAVGSSASDRFDPMVVMTWSYSGVSIAAIGRSWSSQYGRFGEDEDASRYYSKADRSLTGKFGWFQVDSSYTDC